MDLKDTICAIATPPGQGGIGVVRISGNDARTVLKKIWNGRRDALSFESHKMYLGRILEIDTVLAVLMQSPNSYTGEDVVEISCHGGQAILGAVIDACIGAGARPAEPGEFTKRAFLNGRMDLAQAEAVADLIAATSKAASKCAKNQLEGKLSAHIGSLMDGLTALRAFVEASIDFPEEDIEFIEKEGIAQRLREIADRMRVLSNTYNEGRLIHDGVNVAIIGKPNVGKSSLFNALAGRERAIVHHTSGTTRDLVTETIQMNGIAFHLTDGAGIREGEHEVERIGIEKTRGSIEKADVILFVVDGSVLRGKADEEIYRLLDPKKTIVCANKADLPAKDSNTPTPSIHVSALTGKGIEPLKELLLKRTVEGGAALREESVIITSARHKKALDDALEQINEAIRAESERRSAEFIAHHLGAAHDHLGQITGKVGVDTVLNEIFSTFCIGK